MLNAAAAVSPPAAAATATATATRTVFAAAATATATATVFAAAFCCFHTLELSLAAITKVALHPQPTKVFWNISVPLSLILR